MRFLTFLSVAVLFAVAGVNAISVNKLGRARLVSSKEAMDSGAVSYVETTQAPTPLTLTPVAPSGPSAPAAPAAPTTPAPAPSTETTVIIKKKGTRRRRRGNKGGTRRRARRRANKKKLLEANAVDAAAPLPTTFKPVPVLQDGKPVKPDNKGYFTIKQNDAPRVSKKKYKVKPLILLETEQPAAAVAAANSKTTAKQANAEKKKRQRRRRRRAARRANKQKLLKANELDASAPLPTTFKPVSVIDATGKTVKPFDGDYHLVDQGVPKVDANVYKVKPVILLETGETRSAVLRAAKVVAADGSEIARGAPGYTVTLSSESAAPKSAAPALDSRFKKVKIDASATVMIEVSGDNKKKSKAEKKKQKEAKKRLDKFNKALQAKARKLRRSTRKRWTPVRVLDASGKEVKLTEQGYTKFDDVPRVTSPRKFKRVTVLGPDGKPVSAAGDRHVPFIKVKRGKNKGKFVRPAGASFMEVASSTDSAAAVEQHVAAAHMVAKQLEAQKSHTSQVLEKMQFHSQRLTEAIQQAEAMDQSLAEVSAVAQAWNEQKNSAVHEASEALTTLASSISTAHATQDAHTAQLHELSSVLEDFAHAPQPVAFTQIQSYVTQQLAQAISSVSSASPASLDKQVQELTNKMENLTQLLKNKQN